jgi:putative ABC transport system substrate-binding protein
VSELIVDDDDDPRPSLSRRRMLSIVALSAAGATVVGALGVQALIATRAPERRVFKIVFLFTAIDDPAVQTNIAAVKQTMRALGYTEGEHVIYDGRSAERDPTRFRALAAEVVALEPHVIVCQNPQAAQELKAATTTIPIVFVGIGVDAIESGLVASLSRPDGNLTGLSSAGVGIYSKRLELLKECAPKITRVAVLRDPGEPPQSLAEMRQTGPSLGIEILPVDLRTPADLEPGLAMAVARGADAMIYTNTANFVIGTQAAARVIEFTLQNRWPAVIDPTRGGLLSYSGVLVDAWQKGAMYIDRILKGAKPSDLPVEGPAGSRLVLNLCTAAKLGLVIPQSVLAQASDVIRCVP